jgi:catechol 2,3-dioxygenase-like lactoylglutathione lyase family enzyme
MTEDSAPAPPERWYARPVFFVSELARALTFYEGKLGFRRKWHEAEGRGTVCQVDRAGCEIILCEDASRVDRSRLFLELARGAVDDLVRDMAMRDVATERTWWGYEVLRIPDPDGNELLICLEE